ncbi:MAG: histidine--tRNA ligase [Flavobacteriaceae bacterium]|nr:histidine--tRNA ligase [Flavobacteriaceae bacterium]
MKPSIPKGTRDFSPIEIAKRNYIFTTIKQTFETFGFQPIETPSFENSSTLMGKYGEEGDRLIFKILNSGDYLKKVDNDLWKEKNSTKIISKISEKALRYDLTVPFARYVVQHQNEITFPFKRYQMQPVWRADRPQKGRFREFYQCDADVVGSKSLWQEVEFVQLYDAVFTKLGLTEVVIKLNNRKILSGIAEIIGAKDKLIDFTIALDKLDKIGVEGVSNEMLSKGISKEAIEKIQPLFDFTGSNNDKLEQLTKMLSSSEEGMQGVEELQFVIDNIDKLSLQSAALEIDVTLARGLNYYTGAIIEVQTNKVKMGSIGGGGRYDDLTGVFGLKDISGIGISFGLDRIYLVLDALNLFEKAELSKPQIIFLNFDKIESLSFFKAIKALRENDIKCEMYPDLGLSNKQQKKQWKYVSNRDISFVVSKMEGEKFVVKNRNNDEQFICNLDELIRLMSK